MIKERRATLNYRYIIIDEFQDISDGRYGLIKRCFSRTKGKIVLC